MLRKESEILKQLKDFYIGEGSKEIDEYKKFIQDLHKFRLWLYDEDTYNKDFDLDIYKDYKTNTQLRIIYKKIIEIKQNEILNEKRRTNCQKENNQLYRENEMLKKQIEELEEESESDRVILERYGL